MAKKATTKKKPTKRTGKKQPPRQTTVKKKAIFLEALLSMTITEAAKHANLSRATVYKHRDEDPEFAQAWEDAVTATNELLVKSALERAINGTVVEEEFDDAGNLVHQRKQFETALTIFMLKMRLPKTYNRAIGDDGERGDAGGRPIQIVIQPFGDGGSEGEGEGA